MVMMAECIAVITQLTRYALQDHRTPHSFDTEQQARKLPCYRGVGRVVEPLEQS